MRGTTILILAIWGVLAGRAAGSEPSLDDPDPADRRRAVGRLAKIPGRVAMNRLVAALADEDPGVRDRAEAALASREDDREPPLLARIARRDGRIPVRAGLARVLARRPGDVGPETLVDLLGDRAAAVREAAIRGLGTIGPAGAIPALVERIRDRRPGPRVAALEALDRLDPAGSAGRAARLLSVDPDPDVRVAAVLVLARRVGEEADRALLGALLGALEDGCWSVRVVAARTAARLRLPDAIPILIRGLDRETGRVREEFHATLAAVSGVGLPDDPARWRAWWDREEEGFRPPPRPARPSRDPDASTVTYHSIPVTSRAVAFVIDASRSMRDPLRGEEGPTRREGALVELEGTLRRLPGGTRFNVVLFGREIVRWQPRARLASASATTAAMRTARRVPAGGWSDLFAALEAALEDRTVDTIYLLTDGSPSAGRYPGRASLRAAVVRLNRYRLVRIHTVGFGSDRVGKRWRGFLADLAGDHDGVHVAR